MRNEQLHYAKFMVISSPFLDVKMPFGLIDADVFQVWAVRVSDTRDLHDESLKKLCRDKSYSSYPWRE